MFDTKHALKVMFENHRFENCFHSSFFALTHAGKTFELLQEFLVSDARPYHGLTIIKEQVIGRDMEQLGEFFHHVNRRQRNATLITAHMRKVYTLQCSPTLFV